jgi:hypothetical protein
MNPNNPTPSAQPAHTPTPWFAARDNDCDGIDDQTIVAFDTFSDGSRHPRAIAITCRPNSDLAAANRDFIVRACNSHAQLVAALTDIETTARNTAKTFPNMPGRVDLLRIAMNARAALSAAKE